MQSSDSPVAVIPEPFDTFRLSVSPVHQLFVEQVGSPEGLPVLFLHGGPGTGCSPRHRRLLLAASTAHTPVRAVLFDQRGAGQSTPHAELVDNTTWHLVEDIEAIRQRLGIERWVVLGGSWGSTLALVYAQTYPQHVAGLVLRGIFLCRSEEIAWFYQAGAHWMAPEFWAPYQQFIPPEERHDMVAAYYRRLTCDDPALRLEAARHWARWEGANLCANVDEALLADFTVDEKALAVARIECHYFMHGAFLTEETAILNPARLAALHAIPTHLIHGRHDVITPLKNAWDLKHGLPHAQLTVVPNAGHASDEPGIFRAQCAALQQVLNQARWLP